MGKMHTKLVGQKRSASGGFISLDVPTKKHKIFDANESDGEDGEGSFKINEEYARRFEHNHKRAELHRCMLEPHGAFMT
jgi:hypothetical protein